MSAIFILMGVSLFVSLIFLFAYIWSAKQGQFDDDFSPAHRIFFDDHKNKN